MDLDVVLWWQGWRLVNAAAAAFAFGFYVANTVAIWSRWYPEERRVSGFMCALLFVLLTGSLEAYQRGNDVLLSTLALTVVLIGLAGSLWLDRRARSPRGPAA